jgi:hypothetical protein
LPFFGFPFLTLFEFFFAAFLFYPGFKGIVAQVQVPDFQPGKNPNEE